MIDKNVDTNTFKPISNDKNSIIDNSRFTQNKDLEKTVNKLEDLGKKINEEIMKKAVKLNDNTIPFNKIRK